jgi:hypothetical protein
LLMGRSRWKGSKWRKRKRQSWNLSASFSRRYGRLVRTLGDHELRSWGAGRLCCHSLTLQDGPLERDIDIQLMAARQCTCVPIWHLRNPCMYVCMYVCVDP